MPLDRSDGITGYLSGGLGNQLFAYAAALEQSRRLDCPLYLDLSGYDGGNRRAFELEGFGLPGVFFREGSSVGKPTRRGRLGRLLARRPDDDEIFVERGLGYDPRIESVRIGQTLYGYFQAHAYFRSSEPELATMLPAPPQSSASIAVHVRRGDYLMPAHASHGMTTLAYFERAIPLMYEAYGELPLRVYTDSPEQVEDEFTGLPYAFELASNTPELSPWDTVVLMARSRAIVMSNSSFSWWAAWLMRQRDPSVRVIAPRPWVADGASAHDLLYEEWISLGIR
jgi:Glycosyl transferase family 11